MSGSWYLDGINQYIQIADNAALRSIGLTGTWWAWVNKGWRADHHAAILHKNNTTSMPWTSYNISLGSSSTNIAAQRSSGGVEGNTPSFALPEYEWTFVAATYNGNSGQGGLRLRVWNATGSVIFDQSNTSLTGTIGYTVGWPLTIGKNEGGSHMMMDIACVGAHNQVFTDAQLNTLRTTGVPPVTPSAFFLPLNTDIATDTAQGGTVTVYGATFDSTTGPPISGSGGATTVSRSASISGTVSLTATGQNTAAPPPEPPPPTTDPGGGSVEIGGGGYMTKFAIADNGTIYLGNDEYGGYRKQGGKWYNWLRKGAMPGLSYHTGTAGVAVVHNDSTTVYALMGGQGAVFRSTDSSHTWTGPLFTPNYGHPNSAFRHRSCRFVIDRNNRSVLYYGTFRQGLHRCLNAENGDTWTKINSVPDTGPLTMDQNRDRDTYWSSSDPSAAGVMSIVVDHVSGTVGTGTVANPVRSARVYACVYNDGIYRSNDGGNTFTQITSNLKDVYDSALMPDGRVIFCAAQAVSGSGPGWGDLDVWRYDPNANTFTKLNLGSNSDGNQLERVAVDWTPGNHGRVVVLQSGGTGPPSGGRPYRSLDYGNTWTPITVTSVVANDVPWIQHYAHGWFSTGEFSFDRSIPGRMWLGEGIGFWYMDMANNPSSASWYSDTRGVEMVTSNRIIKPVGQNAVVSNWDFATHRITDLHQPESTYHPQGGFLASWDIASSPHNPSFMALLTTDNRYYDRASVEKSAISTNGGVTWTPFQNFPWGPPGQVSNANLWLCGDMIAYGTNRIMWVPGLRQHAEHNAKPHYSHNGGQTWAPCDMAGLTGAQCKRFRHVDYFYMKMIDADQVNTNKVYAFSHEDRSGFKTEFYRSENGGATFAQVNADPFPNMYWKWHAKLRAMPGMEGHLFVCPGAADQTAQSSYRSTNGGNTWTEVNSLLHIHAFGFGAKLTPQQTYATIYAWENTNKTYQYSTDFGDTWTLIDDNIDGILGHVKWVEGDMEVPGRFYTAVDGYGYMYGDLLGTSTPPPPPAGMVGYWGILARPTATAIELTEPGAPTNVVASAGQEQASVNWSLPTSTGGTVITGHNVRYSTNSGSSWTTIGVAAGPPRTITGLTTVSHIFQVAAVNSVGQGPWSASSNAVTPTAVSTGGGTIASYDFLGANGTNAPPRPPWAQSDGSNWQILNNELVQASSWGIHTVRYNSTISPDQFIELDLTHHTSHVYIAVRYGNTNTDPAVDNAVYIRCDPGNPWRISHGTNGILELPGWSSAATPKRLRIQIQGTTVSASLNGGTPVTTSAPGVRGTGTVAIFEQGGGIPGNNRFDNLVIGEIS